MEILRNRFGNTQTIITAHMNALLKLENVPNDDLFGLRKFYDEVETNVRSLSNLGVKTESYSALLVSLVMEKLPQELRLLISRTIKTDLWDLNDVLSIVNQELKERESCPVVVNQPLQMGESDFTGSSLYVSSK